MEQDQPAKTMDRAAGKSAAEIAARARLGDEARGLLAEGAGARAFLDLLIERRLDADAVQVLAFALPKREALWWACLCVERVLGAEPSAETLAALEAARAWAMAPSDENRRAAFPAAEAADIGTPAGCIAAAAYFSGGSVAPPDLPTVEPPEHVTAHLVASALALAAVIVEPHKAAEKHALFLQLGLELASSGPPWPEPEPGPTAGDAGAAEPMTERERRIAELRARHARR